MGSCMRRLPTLALHARLPGLVLAGPRPRRSLIVPAAMATSNPAASSAANSLAPAHVSKPPGDRIEAANGKRPLQHGRKQRKQKKSKRERLIKEGSSEEVLQADIRALLASRRRARGLPEEDEADDEPSPADDALLPEEGTEIEVSVAELSSTGDGLALLEDSDHVYVVPFAVPGDVVRAKVFRHNRAEHHSAADFVSVVRSSPLRDDSRVRCRYFATCSGCQFQMLDYGEQLRRKRDIVVKAYRNFSQLPPELVPPVLDTIGSPLQYGYRTKLTPHFDGPAGGLQRRHKGGGPRPALASCPDVGFMQKGRRKVMDIEDCPIGTDAVRAGMRRERTRLREEFGKYSRGATILLRESTQRFKRDAPDLPAETPPDAIRVEAEHHVDIKTCVSDSNAMTSEYVDSWLFTNPAGSFFQNNNSILPAFTSYVRDHALPPPPKSTTSKSEPAPATDSSKSKDGADDTTSSTQPSYHLIDAYSGSGLFTITLSPLFATSIGIDVAESSIRSARTNAALNDLSEEGRARFVAADAGRLFADVASDPDATVVVLDPPRKGCDADFLAQLLRFGPRRVVYVSCNVHTQARDVGVLVRGVEGGGEGTRYEIESLRGFDFFPQTGHVEGVAVLNRV